MYEHKICIICKKKFKPNSGIQVCCSQDCSTKDRKNKARAKYNLLKTEIKTLIKKCPRCGDIFKEKTGRVGQPKKFCSNKCKNLEMSKRFRLKDKPEINPDYKFKCKACGIEYKANQSNQKYCSEACASSVWVENNKDKILKYRKNFYSNKANKERTYEKQKKYLQTDKAKEKKKKRLLKYKLDGRASLYRSKSYKKLKKNPEKLAKAKIINNIRKRIRQSMHSGTIKNGASINLFGCTTNELRMHIESKFKNGMSWKNYGSWVIDHIIPLSKFNFLNNINERYKANHYSNLQPMWASENLKKSNKIL